MAQVEEKTKKYERLARRCEKSVEWLQKQSKRVVAGAEGRELTKDEAQTLRDRLVVELGFDPSTTDRENIDYDPMRYWVLYIKHIRENYPSDSQRQFLVMERCARTFMARPFMVPKYQNDPRFIRTCILYAEKTSNPSEVFKLMSKIKVGTKVSLFWVAWAWCAEKAEDFQFTEKIFQKALSVGAEPRKLLVERQKHFLRRMSRHWLNASQAAGGEEEEEDGGRGALNSLSSEGVSRNDRTGTSGHVQQRPNGASRTTSSRLRPPQGRRDNKPAVGFAIFQEEGSSPRDVFEDDEIAPGGRQRLAKQSESTKENSMRPELWNERGYGLVNPTSAASAAAPPGIGADSIVGTVRDSAPTFGRPPIGLQQRVGSAAAFDVFVDEEFNKDENDARNTAIEKPADQRSLRQRLDGGTADRLTRDPIRYMKNPSKIKSDELKYDARADDSGEVSERREEKAKPSKIKAHKPEPKESRTGNRDKKPTKEDSSEEDCCYEERRLRAAYYKLISPDDNFNMLKQEDNDRNNSSQMDVSESMNIEESIDEVEMEDDTEDIVIKPAKSVLKSSLRNRPPSTKMDKEEITATENPRRVLFGANTNVVYTQNAAINTSTASSQPDDSFVQPEETINTKFANAEISMMFSSPNAKNASVAESPGNLFDQPLFSTNGKKNTVGSSFAIHDENKEESGGLNFYGNADKNDYIGSNGSSFAIHDENKKESGGLNFSIYQEESNGDGKDTFAIHDENKQESGGLHFATDDKGCIASNGPSSFAIHDENKQKSGGLKFPIYEEGNVVDEDCIATNGTSFAIHDENKKESGGTNFYKDCIASNKSSLAIHDENELESGVLNFSIHQDDISVKAGDTTRIADNKSKKAFGGGLNFHIHQDGVEEQREGGDPQKVSKNSGEDTASLSIIGDVMDGIDSTSSGNNACNEKSAPLGFGIYSDTRRPKQKSNKSSNKYPPRSNREVRTREPEKIVASAAEDTASLSVIGDVMDSLLGCSVTEPPQKSSTGFAIHTDENSCAPMGREPAGFKIFADSNDALKKSPKRDEPAPAGLGFAIFSDDASNSIQKKQKVVSSNNEPCFDIDISRIEEETSNFQIMDENSSTNEGHLKAIDYVSRHKEDMEAAMRKCLSAAAKTRSRYEIFDHRKKQIPKALLRKSFTSGTKIDLFGGETLTIVNELGRGAYGVVLLCTDERGHSDALKIQAPIGSLAHEYSLSMSIEDRVKPDDSGFYPFPRSRALHAFSEGGLFSMTAGSDSGMTLIDVVNTYKKIMGNVPELVAIYYTSRMLKHLESLHQDGKVLHCDVKPDNWVLTSSPKGNDNAGTNAIGGADLMLVDFGRSIDLERVAHRGSNPLRAQFKGSIAADDMECASMRKGMPWGVDLDFFGLAASSFILLFGNHIDVVEDRRTGKWRLRKSFRRYWQRDLWNSLFDSLLNFDSSSDSYCLSEIRIAFDEYIDGKQRTRDVSTHLNQLYTHLPKKR